MFKILNEIALEPLATGFNRIRHAAEAYPLRSRRGDAVLSVSGRSVCL